LKMKLNSIKSLFSLVENNKPNAYIKFK
jgi:hypothetical protein